MVETNFKSDTFRKVVTSGTPSSHVREGPGFHPRKPELGRVTPSTGKAAPMGVTVVEAFVQEAPSTTPSQGPGTPQATSAIIGALTSRTNPPRRSSTRWLVTTAAAEPRRTPPPPARLTEPSGELPTIAGPGSCTPRRQPGSREQAEHRARGPQKPPKGQPIGKPLAPPAGANTDAHAPALPPRQHAP